MNNKTKAEELNRETKSMVSRWMLKFMNALGLTSGLGIILWGAWGLVTFFFDYAFAGTGTKALVEYEFAMGLQLSAICVAMGVIILELKELRASRS